MATSGKAVNDVFTHIAQRTFDQSATVRLMVSEVAGEWLLKLRDRFVCLFRRKYLISVLVVIFYLSALFIISLLFCFLRLQMFSYISNSLFTFYYYY